MIRLRFVGGVGVPRHPARTMSPWGPAVIDAGHRPNLHAAKPFAPALVQLLPGTPMLAARTGGPDAAPHGRASPTSRGLVASVRRCWDALRSG